MAKRLDVSQKKTAKPSKSLAIIAFLFTILLSYLLVSLWSHHHKVKYANKSLSLPELQSLRSDTEESEENNGWTIVKTRSGDSLSSIFQRAGLSKRTLQTVLHNNPHAKALANIKPEQQIQLFIRDEILEKLIFPVSATQFLVVTHDGKNYSSKLKSRKMDSQTDYLTATVRGSLYSTAKRMNVPNKLIRQMTDIFHWEIDFIKDIRAGDQFTMVYQAYYIDDKLVSTGDIIAVSDTNHGKKYQAIRHIGSNGDYDYFTPEGNSLKKAFSRYPIKFSHISSSYSTSRYHPILHYRRAHKGVDLAAPIGTPIYATGDGRIEVIDRHNGYGNMIKIAHDKTYSSLYAHLLKFQKGLSKGTRVKRGQVIGYVGQTGLADGPHCHYEFHIHQQPRNPSTVALPHSSPVPSREIASFKNKAGTLLAQLKLYEDANLVAAGKKSTDTA
jgi:murein DD-endopeptidase MepM/ murein hydrolase activator NlpD